MANPRVDRTYRGISELFAGISVGVPGMHLCSGSRVQTVDATQTMIASYASRSLTAFGLRVQMTAMKSDGTQVASWLLYGVYRNVNGVLTQVGGVQQLAYAADDATWAAALVINGANVEIRGTGKAATTIKWSAQFSAVVGY